MENVTADIFCDKYIYTVSLLALCYTVSLLALCYTVSLLALCYTVSLLALCWQYDQSSGEFRNIEQGFPVWSS